MGAEHVVIRPIEAADRPFIVAELTRNWVSPVIISLNQRFQGDQLPGFIAWLEGERVGQVTIAFEEGECEVVALSALTEGHGIGGALMDAAIAEARRRGCRRARLTMSNDNLRAFGFYQRRGWRLVAVYPGRIDEYRRQGRAIPEIGLNDIPLHDELELELVLT